MVVGPVKAIVVGIYAALVIVGTAQVLSRYAFGFSLAWSEEFIRYAFFWSVMLTVALIAGDGAHLKVDYVSDHLPPRLRKAWRLFSDALFLTFAVVLIWFGADLTWRAVEGGSRSPAMNISMGWIYLAFPVGGVLTAGLYLRHCLRRGADSQ